MLDDRERKAKLFPVVVYVYHQYKKRYLATGYKVEKKYWGNGEVTKHKDAAIINSRVAEIISEAKNYFAECQLKKKPVNLELLGQKRFGYSLTKFLAQKAIEYEKKDKPIMRQKTTRIAKDLKACFNREIFFDDLTPAFLREFDTHLSQTNKATTRRNKFEYLGDWYDQAITDGRAVAPNPFDGFKISGKPVKREKLTPAEILAIENLDLQGEINDARNLFLFAYYCKGQRFRACITLQKKDVRNDRIYFKTDKGQKFISVKIHERLRKILDYYKDLPGPFVLPFITELPKTKKGLINLSGNVNAAANVNLKTVAKQAGITINLTYHIARHTFAFHFKKKTKNINAIQEALGHSDQRTTMEYLKELDDEFLDDEVSKVYGD